MIFADLGSAFWRIVELIPSDDFRYFTNTSHENDLGNLSRLEGVNTVSNMIRFNVYL